MNLKKEKTIKRILLEMNNRLNKLNTKTTNISVVTLNGNLKQLINLPEEFTKDLNSLDKMFSTITQLKNNNENIFIIKKLKVIHNRMKNKIINFKIAIEINDKTALKVLVKEYNSDIKDFQKILKEF